MLLQTKNPKRPGYTLLEVILASMLTAVVLLILATSMHIQFRAFDSGRSQVAEAQLARVLLHRIGDDLRALLPPREAPGSSSTAGGGAGGTVLEGGGDAEMVAGLTEDQSSLVDDTLFAAESPGVYGEFDCLRVDVVRAKRRDAVSADISAVGVTPSQSQGEIDTIVYYVVSSETLGTAGSAETDAPAGGLVRRELSRPTAAYAADSGMLEYYDETITPLAPEVTAIEFRYHDGQDWVEAWDSSESGGLPKAIEIRLYFAPIARTTGITTAALAQAAGATDEKAQYRLVVPVAVVSSATRGGVSAADDVSDFSLFGEEMSMPGGGQ